MTKLRESIDRLADVWVLTFDARDMYAAMQWVEAESLAWALFDGGHAPVAAGVLRAWQAANTEDDVAEFAGESLDAALFAFGVLR